MQDLPRRILQQAAESRQDTLLCPNTLLHLGSRAAVDQALSRLARRGELMRICQGVYVRPTATPFGPCPPAIEKVIESLSSMWGETIVPCGGALANALGFTTQVPIRSVYLTSGRSRNLTFGKLIVELRHAPRWQLVAPYRPAGDVVRALAWLGPEEIEENLERLAKRLSSQDLDELAATRAAMPAWIAEPISAVVASAAAHHARSVTPMPSQIMRVSISYRWPRGTSTAGASRPGQGGVRRSAGSPGGTAGRTVLRWRACS